MSGTPSPPCRHWKLATRSLTWQREPLLMGIVNVTPDSFSDGGKFLDPDQAIHHALRLVEQGADILDIGGESTRPYSETVPLEEELHRVLPVIKEVCRQSSVPVSIDTSKARVAEAAIDAGAEIINDVTGLQGDPAMLRVAQQTRAAVCVMHMLGTPQTMQDNPTYGDVVAEIYDYLQQRRDALIGEGIDPQQICLDPGIGFGKSHAHNLQLLARCREFLMLDCPVLVGHSRKGFIANVLGDKSIDRTAGSVGVALSLARQGVHILRVHDVAAVRQALKLFAATGGLED
jgi:dihydropteroate synthase